MYRQAATKIQPSFAPRGFFHCTQGKRASRPSHTILPTHPYWPAITVTGPALAITGPWAPALVASMRITCPGVGGTRPI